MICWVLAMEMLQGVWKQHLRPRALVGYGVKIFLPSPPNYVTRSPGWIEISTAASSLRTDQIETSPPLAHKPRAFELCSNALPIVGFCLSNAPLKEKSSSVPVVCNKGCVYSPNAETSIQDRYALLQSKIINIFKHSLLFIHTLKNTTHLLKTFFMWSNNLSQILYLFL